MNVFDYNDLVRVVEGAHKGKIGSIVGFPTAPSTTYTVEFGDGSDAEFTAEQLLLEPSE